MPVCPNEATREGESIFESDQERCTECVGTEDELQCVFVCSADCIFDDPDNEETEEESPAKYESFHG